MLEGNDERPGRDDAPVLHRAFADARSLRATWAEHYGLPRTDPRYLDATDEQVVEDLLVLLYRAGERRRADPMASQIDEVLRDPAAARAADDEFAAGITAGKMAERILAFERARAKAETGSKGHRPVTRVRSPKRSKPGGRK